MLQTFQELIDSTENFFARKVGGSGNGARSLGRAMFENSKSDNST
jgi:hypothetical protein